MISYKRLVSIATLVLASVAACSVSDVNVNLKKISDAGAKACLHASECSSHEVCVFAKCSTLCAGDRDCPGGRCLATKEDGNACVTADVKCPDQSCPAGSICAGGTCRNQCGVGDAGSCLGDQNCSAAKLCVGTVSAHDPAATSDLGSGGGAGGSGGSGGSRAGGAGGQDASVTGSGGSGGADTAGAGGTTSTGGISGAAGSGGSVETGGAGGAGETDAGSGDGTAVGKLGDPCPQNGARACDGHAQQQQLICVNHVWGGNGTCTSPANYNCDSTPGATPGSCRPIVAECAGRKGEDIVCQGMNRVACGPDLVTTTPVDTCVAGTETCTSGACTTCGAGTANCDANATDCETNLKATTTCGTTCGNKVACSTANGTASCTAGTCGMASCKTGYGDCTAGNNGCETDLNAVATCGATCGTKVACPLYHSCGGGTCGPLVPPCVTNGATQAAIIGDSYVTGALSPALQPALATLDPSAGSFKNYAVAGTSLASGGLGLIPPQLDQALAQPISFLIMDGGANDLLICNQATYPGCNTLCNKTGSSTQKVCTDIVQAAFSAATSLLTKAANAGVKDVLYFFYPHVPTGSGGYSEILDYAEPLAKSLCDSAVTTTNGKLTCHFVSTRAAFAAAGGDMNAANFVADGIHPSAAGQTIVATQIWNKMKADCLGQASGCCQ